MYPVLECNVAVPSLLRSVRASADKGKGSPKFQEMFELPKEAGGSHQG